MHAEFVFELASLLAIVGWLLLAVGVCQRGRWQQALLFAGGRLIPLVLCGIYLAVLIVFWHSAPGGNYQSFDGVVQLFSASGKVLGGWLHFLAFDLFIGRWMIDERLKANRRLWSLLVTLPLTFMFGPVGLLLHFALAYQRPAVGEPPR